MSVFNVHGFSRKLIMWLDSRAQKTEAICRGITGEARGSVWVKKFTFRCGAFIARWTQFEFDFSLNQSPAVNYLS